MPALTQAILDRATLDALFEDLRVCTRLRSIIPKLAAGVYAENEQLDLAAARTGLLAGRFRGVQIRYAYQGQEWCDTLLSTPQGVRIVRMSDECSKGTATGQG